MTAIDRVLPTLTRRDVIGGGAAALAGLALLNGKARAQTRIPIIDTHVHLARGLRRRESIAGQAQVALRVMDALGIERAIAAPPPFTPDHPGIYDRAELESVARQYPRLAFMAGGGSLNPIIQATPVNRVDDGVLRRFGDTAAAIAAAGAAGFSEFAVEHFSSGRGAHPYESAPADHPLFFALADIAAKYGMPVEIHMEAVPQDMPFPATRLQSERNPDRLQANIPAFERLLAHNPAARIVWVHAGWDLTGERRPPLMSRLLRDHSNLSMSIKFDENGPRRDAPMTPDESNLRPPWLAMLNAFPDRFVIGSDFFADEGTERLEDVRRLVDALPPGIAPKIARENAPRIYRLL